VNTATVTVTKVGRSVNTATVTKVGRSVNTATLTKVGSTVNTATLTKVDRNAEPRFDDPSLNTISQAEPSLRHSQEVLPVIIVAGFVR
jgi:hypothetical protein